MDTLTEEKRSWNMSRITGKNTGPELAVRSLLHRHGYRFRLHRKDLPGTPDIILPKYRIAIFVHGCFWHRHPDCRYAYTPKSRTEFWRNKFKDNIKRDRVKKENLRNLGWYVLTIWECQTRKESELKFLVNIIDSLNNIETGEIDAEHLVST